MRGFLKVVIWIVVLIGVLVGVYFILPEYPQSVVKSKIQPITDAQAKARIEAVQGLTVKDLDGATYRVLLETKAENPCWVYEIDETTGVEKVTFFGRGYQINLKDWTEYNGMLSTNATIKFEFEITNGSNVKIHAYVDGTLMEIADKQKENEKIRLDILTQAYTGKGLEE
ncbi:MAG: hypothetical protein IJP29_06685 [Lachnospiraceae bacterium]|nr:hypothetical protein [Lachnospiraceae bacterium]